MNLSPTKNKSKLSKETIKSSPKSGSNQSLSMASLKFRLGLSNNAQAELKGSQKLLR